MIAVLRPLVPSGLIPFVFSTDSERLLCRKSAVRLHALVLIAHMCGGFRHHGGGGEVTPAVTGPSTVPGPSFHAAGRSDGAAGAEHGRPPAMRGRGEGCGREEVLAAARDGRRIRRGEPRCD